jgi:hypothetical protein
MQKNNSTNQQNVNLLFSSSKLLLSVWLAILTCFVTAQNSPLRYIAYPADSLQNITPDRFFQSTLALKAPNRFTEIKIHNIINLTNKPNTVKL